MCGIVGFISKKNNKKEILLSQLETLNHRGPDDLGYFVNDNIALGHTRLAIIDIEHAKQPMVSQDENYIIVFNGEIYNYLELRQQLVQKGIKFKTFSDTEVLLNMYIVYKNKCVKYLNGMFSFAIYDIKEKKLFLARDHFGIKPLYYTFLNNEFIFASEIKAILKYPNIKKEVDYQSLSEYTVFQQMLKKHTLFRNIHILEPASYMIVKDNKVKKIKYWDYDYNIDDSVSKEQYLDELLLLLKDSSNIQTRADVPIGAYLSGGIDSSLISTLSSYNQEQIHTFTGGFKESEVYDESKYAKIVSDSIGSIHHTVFPTFKDFEKVFEKIIYHMDYPEAGPGVFSQYMVSKLAKEHVKVVLGGQGGDEIFGGYTRYAVAYLEQALKGAIFETSEEGKHIVTLQSMISNLPQLRQYVPMLKEQWSSGLFESMDRRYFNLIKRTKNIDKIYTKDFSLNIDEEQLFDKFSQIFNHPKTKSYFNKMTHFDLKTQLHALLHVEDRVSMAVSLESRVPMLDYRIVELANKMPPTIKFANGKTKSVLMDIAKNILPNKIVNRKDKMGFPTPINEWLAGPLKEYALDILTSKKAKERGILDINLIENQINKNGKFNRDLWGALNLEIWFKVFIDE